MHLTDRIMYFFISMAKPFSEKGITTSFEKPCEEAHMKLMWRHYHPTFVTVPIRSRNDIDKRQVGVLASSFSSSQCCETLCSKPTV
ncbi:hypothetical protein CDAR_410481 [Caerostris darwini]|uniref:Uncharacterized protein n=1 Tax=Caerostris darwini TaxID=1538125 RepID=A0AAV4MXS3_9ARAC|nr:hypothetical protein CDAR_410481 [Caerostris darwini]